MTTAPPTKPNTNSSMHPGLMALRWHGETPEPGGLHGGQRGIFVVRICHSAAASKTMPSAAAFHSILQQLRSDDVTGLPTSNPESGCSRRFRSSWATGRLLTTFLSAESWLSSLATMLGDLHNLFTLLHQTEVSLANPFKRASL